MIEIKETEDVFSTVSAVFDGDKKLLMQYHYMSPSTIGEAVSWTTDYIVHGTKGASFYCFLLSKKIVGYACADSKQVYEIGVRHDSRALLPDMLLEIRKLHPSLEIVRLFKEDYRSIRDLVAGGLAKRHKHDDIINSQILLKLN